MNKLLYDYYGIDKHKKKIKSYFLMDIIGYLT